MAAEKFSDPTWLYSADGPKLFAEGDELPGKGWFDHPDKVGGKSAEPAAEKAPKAPRKAKAKAPEPAPVEPAPEPAPEPDADPAG